MTTDWRGTPIKVGSLVVYPARVGSSLWMNEGIVEDIKVVVTNAWGTPKDEVKIVVRRTRTSDSWRKEGKKASYPDPDRVTVIA